jgi:N6-L-threonylcarbamoyladenine synthase
LGVGVNKAKQMAHKYNKPLIPINHIEAHLLSPLAKSKYGKNKFSNKDLSFPSYGLCVSGGNTIFVLINKIGDYKILAQTEDDALGEALDKGARMIGIGYPGGAVLEKFAIHGNKDKYKLPVPLIGQEKRMIFSYSGLKTSFYRLLEKHKIEDNGFPNKNDIYNLSASFQNTAFKHIERVLNFYLKNQKSNSYKSLLLGGGVAANIDLRLRLRKLGEIFGFKVHIPYSRKMCGDNAAMIGVTAYLKTKNQNFKIREFFDYNKIDRNPKLKLNDYN